MAKEIGLSEYISELGKIPLLSADEERDLARRSLKGDKKAKERLITSNLRLVIKLAAGFLYRGLSFEDLIEEGNLGLIFAVDRFNPEKGYRFGTYARWWIINFVRMAINKTAPTIRLPASLIGNISRWKKISLKLSQELGREPSYEEIVEKLGASNYFIRFFKRYLQSSSAGRRRFYYEIVSSDMKVLSGEVSPLSVSAATDENESTQNLIKKLLATISQKEANILSIRYGLNHKKKPLSLRRVARKFGLSSERIRQIEIKALQRLHNVYYNKL
ncbi:MAG: RNA polymerase sigma factor RpoD/SigA [Planctomycetota bacterium]|nr:RNA polymerase sigma factor RpoD/SigA [Planctomycetota bacterium]MDI6786745.1 RNA polymerase sigma factor RpoD/SigA [Planctomycetota bacterium]